MSTLDSILTHQHLSAHNHRLSSALWIPLNKSYFSRFSNGSEEDYNDDDSTTQGENFNDSRQEINDEETILFTTNLYENIEKFFDENDIHLTSPDEGSNSCKSSKSFIQLKTPVCFEPTATTTTADNDEQLSSMAIPRFLARRNSLLINAKSPKVTSSLSLRRTHSDNGKGSFRALAL